ASTKYSGHGTVESIRRERNSASRNWAELRMGISVKPSGCAITSSGTASRTTSAVDAPVSPSSAGSRSDSAPRRSLARAVPAARSRTPVPVDDAVGPTAASSHAPTPRYSGGAKIVELAVEGGCNAVASTFGVLGSVARPSAHRIPFICKLNHNELLTYPTHYDQVLFGTVKEAWEMGAVAVGATIYWGSEQSDRQLQEIAVAFAEAHELG